MSRVGVHVPYCNVLCYEDEHTLNDDLDHEHGPAQDVRCDLCRSPQATSSGRPCPECASGRCGLCDGTAWDELTDEPCACTCWAANHLENGDPEDDDR